MSEGKAMTAEERAVVAIETIYAERASYYRGGGGCSTARQEEIVASAIRAAENESLERAARGFDVVASHGDGPYGAAVAIVFAQAAKMVRELKSGARPGKGEGT
jgi:hypothetical protein